MCPLVDHINEVGVCPLVDYINEVGVCPLVVVDVLTSDYVLIRWFSLSSLREVMKMFFMDYQTLRAYSVLLVGMLYQLIT